ncbi:MAG: hypothetical protein KAJ66_03200 [Candidatus Omnitrophica bacterium]|nr:hypothetical protein [Candidatus Omnitrophota bacterium]
MGLRNNFSILKPVVKANFVFLRRYPRAFIPFLITALASSLVLLILYLIPMSPLNSLLGQPVTDFYGAQYLHYPYNFTLLPRLFSNARNFLVNPLMGSLMAAIAVGMVCNYHRGREPAFFRNFNKAMRRFIHIAGCMVLMVTVSYLLSRAVPYLVTKLFPGISRPALINSAVTFFVLAGAECFFVYTFIAIMYKRMKFGGALKESFVFSGRLYLVTFALIFSCRLLDFGATLIVLRQPYLMDRFVPDITLLILFFGIIVAVFSDALVYTLAANLYIFKEHIGESLSNDEVQ